MANSGGPSPENKVASAFIEVQTTGVPQVQADLQKVKAATEQATGTQVAGQNKVTEAVAKTGGTFADLRAKLNESQPAAANLMVTLSDLANVAERFYEIGKAIRMFVEDSERFGREVDLMVSASQGVQTQQGKIVAGARQYNPEALKAAGSSLTDVLDLDRRTADIQTKLRGDEKNPGLIAEQTNRGLFGNIADGLLSGATLGGLDPAERRADEINKLGKDLARIERQRAGILQRAGTASFQLDAAKVQSQNAAQFSQQFTSTPIASEDALRRLTDAMEENNRLIKEQRNQPRAGY